MGRSNKQETELLQRRIWMHRCRGMTLQKIAGQVGKSKSTVAYHLKKARANAYEWYEGVGEQEVVGEMLLNHRELRQEALRNLARTQPGSTARLQWSQEARQCVKAESNFLFDLGLMKKAPEQLDVTMTDVRNMSADEIARTIARLQKQLAYTPVQGINMDRGGDAIGEVVIDVDSKVDEAGGNGNGVRQLSGPLGKQPEDVPPADDDDDDDDEDNWEEFDPYSATHQAPAEHGP